jgi:hypothetical protein
MRALCDFVSLLVRLEARPQHKRQAKKGFRKAFGRVGFVTSH